MTSVLAVGYVFSALAALLAWRLAARRPDYRPVALLLTLGLGIDVARRALGLFVISPARVTFGTAPFVGFARAAGHVDSALFLAWPAGLAALAIFVFSRRRSWAVLAIYVVAVVVLVIAYPLTRGDVLRRAYLAAELAALLIAVGTFLMWAIRGEAVTVPHLATMMILSIDLATLLGPWRGNVFTSWPAAQVMYTTLYAALAILQGVSSWFLSRPSRSG